MASFTAIFTIFVLASLSAAHMFLTTPRPFDIEAGYNAPLDGPGMVGSEGSMTYPCQVQNYDFSFARTVLPAGSNYNLSLAGTAVHGGGSCQLSLTTDLQPTSSSEFYVIHSIQGGCPARNTPGNLDGGSASTPDPFQYEFTIPTDIPTGEYTFSWTWFNHVGNREMYMHCAPIEITGPPAKRATSSLSSRPKMFLANIPGVPCSTSYTGELALPDPGESVEVNVDPSFGPAQAPVVAAGGTLNECYAPLKAAVVSGTSAVPSATEIPSFSSTSTFLNSKLTTLASAPYPSLSSSSLVTGTGTGTGTIPIPTVPAASGSGTCATGQVPCTASVICIGSTQFGLCARGCAVPQDLSAGTNCVAGVITRRSMPRPGHGWWFEN